MDIWANEKPIGSFARGVRPVEMHDAAPLQGRGVVTEIRDQAARDNRTEPTVFWAFTSSVPLTAATSRVRRSSAAS